MIGAAFAAAAPSVPSWSAGFKNGNDMGGLLAAILAPAGGFGKFLLVLLAVSVSSTCAPLIYSFGECSLIRRCEIGHQAFFFFFLTSFLTFYDCIEPLILFFPFSKLFYGDNPLFRSSASICLYFHFHSHVSE